MYLIIAEKSSFINPVERHSLAISRRMKWRLADRKISRIEYEISNREYSEHRFAAENMITSSQIGPETLSSEQKRK